MIRINAVIKLSFWVSEVYVSWHNETRCI